MLPVSVDRDRREVQTMRATNDGWTLTGTGGGSTALVSVRNGFTLVATDDKVGLAAPTAETGSDDFNVCVAIYAADDAEWAKPLAVAYTTWDRFTEWSARDWAIRMESAKWDREGTVYIGITIPK